MVATFGRADGGAGRCNLQEIRAARGPRRPARTGPADPPVTPAAAGGFAGGGLHTGLFRRPQPVPEGLLLSVLQQEPEIRLAAYRLIAALVARPWCLSEVCSKQDIVNMVTDPEIETTKNGMEARYLCCTGISKSLSASNKLSDPALSGIVEKLQEAVRRGPYLVAKKHAEAKPIVVTAERF